MTEDEAIGYVRTRFYSICNLPKEFHTKKFVLKMISSHSYYFSQQDSTRTGIKIDYDIALANEIVRYDIGYSQELRGQIINHEYGAVLTEDEINKLITTLSLIS